MRLLLGGLSCVTSLIAPGSLDLDRETVKLDLFLFDQGMYRLCAAVDTVTSLDTA